MIDFLFRVLLAIFACIGLVQTISWFAVRTAAKNSQVLRIFPVGGAGRSTGKQMSTLYACLQWEANPAAQTFVLYDMGLDEKDVQNCEELARGAGVAFVRHGDLEAFLEK